MFAALCALSVVAGSCSGDDEVVCYEYQPVDNNVWDRQYKMTFRIDTIANSGAYDLQVCLRALHNVQFQKVYVVVEQQYANPYAASVDTVCLTLTDEMGNMEGKGLSLFNYTAQLPHKVNLRRGQSGTVTLRHAMRRMQLQGINQVGVKLTR